MSRVQVKANTGPRRCAFCHDDLTGATVGCGTCATHLHSDCWRLSSGCVSPGCEGEPSLKLGDHLAGISGEVSLAVLRGRALSQRRGALLGHVSLLVVNLGFVLFSTHAGLFAIALPFVVLLTYQAWQELRAARRLVDQARPQRCLLTVELGLDRPPRLEDLLGRGDLETYRPAQALLALSLVDEAGRRAGPFMFAPSSLPDWLARAQEETPVLATGLSHPGELLVLEGEPGFATLSVPAQQKLLVGPSSAEDGEGRAEEDPEVEQKGPATGVVDVERDPLLEV